jgi:alkylation response protein AidB-like acyl-CoA dehydrogenase
MGIQLTEEQELIRNTAREFAEKEVRAVGIEIDKTHQPPLKTIARMAELGFFGLTIPEEYGGSGGDFLSYICVAEEIGRACAVHANILSVHTAVCSMTILTMGNEEQKKKYLPQLTSGKRIGAFAVTEPGAGSDAAAQKTVAVLEGDHYVLNGSKCFITNGGIAGLFVVLAMTDPNLGTKGLTAFLVERESPGFVVGQAEEKMGQHGSSTTELIFNNCIVPEENVLGKVGEGFKVVMKSLDTGRISIATQALGLAQAALEASIEYAKERKQFGKPISANQGIQWMIADMSTAVEAARLLIQNAATRKMLGLPFSKESAMAKMYASEVAMDVTTKAIQIHGGIGYTTKYPVERYFRDAKVIEIYEGSNQIQRMVIARSVLN